MNNLLTKFIRATIAEAAKTIKSASEGNLALMINNNSDEVELCLYSPDKILAMLPVLAKNRDQRELIEDLKNTFAGAIVGTITVSPPTVEGECNGAWEVIASAAEGGFGPMLYDIAMSMTPNKTMMADRNSVSNSAKGVWQFYFNNRKDVKSKELDDIENPKTPDPSDDCGNLSPPEIRHGKDVNPLNYSYSGTKVPSGRELNRKHEEFLDQAFAIMKPTGMLIAGKPFNKMHAMAFLRNGCARFFIDQNKG